MDTGLVHPGLTGLSRRLSTRAGDDTCRAHDSAYLSLTVQIALSRSASLPRVSHCINGLYRAVLCVELRTACLCAKAIGRYGVVCRHESPVVRDHGASRRTGLEPAVEALEHAY